MKSGFLEKLIARLDRVEPGEVQSLLFRLMRERGFLERVFEALREGVVVLDPDGTITFVNQAACRFFGLDAGKAVGQRLASQVRGLDWAGLAKPGKVVSRDMEVFYPENRYLNFYMAPIADSGKAGDAQLGYVMLVRDITQSRRQAEETLETERLNALTLLAAGVAHEIGNPLNSMDIHLQLLDRKLRKLDPDARAGLGEHLATARGEIRRLDGILKQFLAAVRPSVPQRERQDLHALIEGTLKLLEPELASRNIQVSLDFAGQLPELEVDGEQLRQVFYNLISNAYQSLRASGGRIDLTTRANDYEVIITVADNGSGISPEVMGSLFEPYLTTKAAGTGLGLLIVRRIVREHGGEIEIESEAGAGTRVILYLPRAEKNIRLLGMEPSRPVIDIDPD